jgi:hypothetical protein
MALFLMTLPIIFFARYEAGRARELNSPSLLFDAGLPDFFPQGLSQDKFLKGGFVTVFKSVYKGESIQVSTHCYSIILVTAQVFKLEREVLKN